MLFKDIIGQHTAIDALQRMVENGRMPHALLLSGAPGSGDLALAIAMAQYVLCEQPKDQQACDTCSACRKAARYVHPDLHFSFPVIGSGALSDNHLPEWRAALSENAYLNVNQWLHRLGAENKQGNINKDECLAIQKKLSLKAFEGKYKVLVLWLPEFLGKEGNRLLKLIEEPPPDTLIILVTNQTDMILNTILSRCQVIRVPPLRDEAIAEALVLRQGLDTEKAKAVALLAAGDYNEALSLRSRAEHDYAGQFLDWMRKCYRGNGAELVTWADSIAATGRESQKQFLQYGLHFLREYLVLQTRSSDKVRLLPNELQTAGNLRKIMGWEAVVGMERLLSDCSYYVERNANQKLLFLDASLRLNNILKNETPTG
ncbi:MAG: hypothetical protein RLY31_1819 [Bacteroidota bacterium]